MRLSIALGAFLVLLSLPVRISAQPLAPVTLSERWDVSLHGQVGVPRGYLRVGENAMPGTRLRLHEDLGIDVSGGVEGSVAYHFTTQDAVRATIAATFIDGSSQTNHQVFYNGAT